MTYRVLITSPRTWDDAELIYRELAISVGDELTEDQGRFLLDTEQVHGLRAHRFSALVRVLSVRFGVTVVGAASVFLILRRKSCESSTSAGRQRSPNPVRSRNTRGSSPGPRPRPR